MDSTSIFEGVAPGGEGQGLALKAAERIATLLVALFVRSGFRLLIRPCLLALAADDALGKDLDWCGFLQRWSVENSDDGTQFALL